MARLPAPAAVQRANGALVKDPGRRRSEPKAVAKLGNAPAHFDEKRKALWEELRGMISPGVLVHSDAWLIEDLIELKYESRYDRSKWNQSKQGNLNWLYAHCGMTPVDRCRVTSDEQENEDPAEAYLN